MTYKQDPHWFTPIDWVALVALLWAAGILFAMLLGLVGP